MEINYRRGKPLNIHVFLRNVNGNESNDVYSSIRKTLEKISLLKTFPNFIYKFYYFYPSSSAIQIEYYFFKADDRISNNHVQFKQIFR